jgi:hypothetical protein
LDETPKINHRTSVISATVTDDLPLKSPANPLWAESNGVLPKMRRRSREMVAVVKQLATGESVSTDGVSENVSPPGNRTDGC